MGVLHSSDGIEIKVIKDVERRMKKSSKGPHRISSERPPRGIQEKKDQRSPRTHKGSVLHRSMTRGAHKAHLAPRETDPPIELIAHNKPSIIHRDTDLLILNKPTGWLTHPDGREGVEARPDLVSWVEQTLQLRPHIHQRLDVSTSGVIAFSLSSRGDQRLSELEHRGEKVYLAVVEGGPSQARGQVNQPVPRAPTREAITQYQVKRRGRGWSLVEARLLTGRTHQIRFHMQTLGCPIRGDGLYGDPFDLRAPRVLLHAYQLRIQNELFQADPPACFARYLDESIGGRADPFEAALALRADLAESEIDECYRISNGGPEGFSGWRVDRYGEWAWVIHDEGTPEGLLPEGLRGVYRLEAMVDRSQGQQPHPVLWRGGEAPQPLIVREAGVRYAVELGEQLSTGLFLDQRPQRAWLAHARQPMGRVLNTFAHAGGFSIAAARSGSETVSIDLSSRWLSRLPYQLELNEVDPAQHHCLTGDVFDWLHRLTKRGERFDLIILDPPSTSVGTKRKRWSAAKDYPLLVQLALPLLSPGGRLMTSTNHRKLTPSRFATLVESAFPKGEGYYLERVCAPGVDFPSDEPLGVKNLIWRAPQ